MTVYFPYSGLKKAIKNAIKCIFVLLLITAILGSCEKTPVTPTTVDFSLNLNDASNKPLKTKGGYIYSNNIIIAYTTNGAYVALSQACTNDNTSVIYDGNNDRFHCPKDNSNFSDGGGVINGPASTGLKIYAISHTDANTIRIQSQ